LFSPVCPASFIFSPLEVESDPYLPGRLACQEIFRTRIGPPPLVPFSFLISLSSFLLYLTCLYFHRLPPPSIFFSSLNGRRPPHGFLVTCNASASPGPSPLAGASGKGRYSFEVLCPFHLLSALFFLESIEPQPVFFPTVPVSAMPLGSSQNRAFFRPLNRPWNDSPPFD